VQQVLGEQIPALTHLLGVALLAEQQVLPVLVVQQLQLALERRVEVVLDVVVRAAGQQLSDLRPLAPHVLVQLYYLRVLLLCPLVLFNVRVQMVVPPIII